MLVLLFFHNLGYSPLEIASLFLLYEFFGMVTNLYGGWLASRYGLTLTMQLGLGLQILALALLLADPSLLSVVYVMVAQAISGIAKDLNKMSAKSAIKTLVPERQQGTLFKWVAFLTGSKNTLKGIGFFVGGILLNALGFRGAIAFMAALLCVILMLSLVYLRQDLSRKTSKANFTDMFATSKAVNVLSLARMFLFGSRDVWFVIALPIFLSQTLHWDHRSIGALLAGWVIVYGVVQALAPKLTGYQKSALAPDGKAVFYWALLLTLAPIGLAGVINLDDLNITMMILGLLVFGVLFAINSSLHSYLIVRYADRDGSSMNIGFYYMANAVGRLIGTIASGWIYQKYGLAACLYASSMLLCAAAVVSIQLPREQP